jgi:hypothetical protein
MLVDRVISAKMGSSGPCLQFGSAAEEYVECVADADYGSQYQLRRWVNEEPDELTRRILGACQSLREWPPDKVEWLSPTPAHPAELRDEAWAAVGLPSPSPQEADWWPVGGPVWDAVARVEGPDEQCGGVFIEAKGRRSELRGPGTRAQDERRDKIKTALFDVQASIGVGPPPADWLGRSFQPANRLAYLWFSRVKNDPAAPVWLISMYFLAETYRDTVKAATGPATEAEWRPLIGALHQEMELPEPPHLLSPYWGEVFLECVAGTGPPPARWNR